MPQAQREILEERALTERPVADETLLCVGSVHNEITDKADAPHRESDMHQDLLDIEASMMCSNVIPSKNHSSKEMERHPTRRAQESARKAAPFSVIGTTPFDVNEVSVGLNAILVDVGMRGSDNVQVNESKEAHFEAETGNNAKKGRDGENWSVMAEGSQKSGR